MPRGTTITVQQLQEALRALKGTSGDAKFRSLISVLDEDHDGNMNLDEIAEVSFFLSLPIFSCTHFLTLFSGYRVVGP